MLGFSRYTNEYYYWNSVKIETSRALQRFKRYLRWNVPALEGVSYDMQTSGVNKGAIINEEFREKSSHPRKSVKIDPGHHRTLRSSKPTGSDTAAPLGPPNASTPVSTDWAKPEDRTARRALRDSERRLRLPKKAKTSLRRRTRG